MKKMHEMPLDFAALALDCKAALGLATTMNPTAEYATVKTNAGFALYLNSWDQITFGLCLVSRPLFE